MNRATTNLITACYVGFYGVTLYYNPDMFYGPDGMLPYFKQNTGHTGEFFGRAFGAMLLTIAAGYFHSKNSATVSKINFWSLVLMYPLFFMCAQDEEHFVTKMWKMQFVPQTIFAALNYMNFCDPDVQVMKGG